MSSLLLSKVDIGLKLCFAHNDRYGNSVTVRIGIVLESMQYLDDHEPKRLDSRIELGSYTCIVFKTKSKTILSPSKNEYLRRNKHFCKWCVSIVF